MLMFIYLFFVLELLQLTNVKKLFEKSVCYMSFGDVMELEFVEMFFIINNILSALKK